MSILKKIFGDTHLIVDNIIYELESLNSIVSDRKFIDFVERIEKAKRNVSYPSLGDEIASVSVMARLSGFV